MIRYFYYSKKHDADRHFNYGRNKGKAGRCTAYTLKKVNKNDTVLVWTDKYIAVGSCISEEMKKEAWPPSNKSYDTVDVEWQKCKPLTARLFSYDDRCKAWSFSFKSGCEESEHVQAIGRAVIEKLLKKNEEVEKVDFFSKKTWQQSQLAQQSIRELQTTFLSQRQ